MNKVIKYLLCVFFSMLAINFIISAISCFSSISSYLISSQIVKNPSDQSIISIGKELESKIQITTEDLKLTHGEDYPALGIMYYRSISHYSSVSNVQNFVFSLICGFALGNIIYLIFIAKFKSYKLIIFLIISLFLTGFLLALSDILTFIANGEKIKFGLSQIFWNMEATTIPYIIVSLILYGINKVCNVYIEIQNS